MSTKFNKTAAEQPATNLCGRDWFEHEVTRNDYGEITHLAGKPVAGMTTYELFPDLQEEMSALTLGGYPMYDSQGHLIDYPEDHPCFTAPRNARRLIGLA